MSEEKPGDVIEKRRRKLQELKETGIIVYPNDFRVTHCIADIQGLVAAAADGEAHLSEPIVSVAGRMMAINRFGKSAFIRFRDRSGQLQAYIQKDKVGDQAYELFKKLEAGDIVGIVGTLFKTKTGEWTLLANEFRLLCKAIRPLPEKFHGLKDPEKRYRQRYLDLIMNPSVRELFMRRSRLIQAMVKVKARRPASPRPNKTTATTVSMERGFALSLLVLGRGGFSVIVGRSGMGINKVVEGGLMV